MTRKIQPGYFLCYRLGVITPYNTAVVMTDILRDGKAPTDILENVRGEVATEAKDPGTSMFSCQILLI